MSIFDKSAAFKDSPIGPIPRDWLLTNLADLAELITSGSRGWALYYSDQGSLFIRIGNLTREHINLRFDDVQYVTPPKGTEGQRTKVEANDLLISITADLGIVGMVPSDFCDAYVNQHIALIRLKPEVRYPRWIGHLISSPCYQKVFQALNDSGAKAGMNLPAVGALPVVLPSNKAEQRYVVETLDTLDAAIEKSEALIAKLKQVRAGMLYDLLTCGVDENGDVRDPSANHKEFAPTPLGYYPKDWKRESLGALFEMQLGKMLNPKARLSNSPSPYLTNRHVQWGNIDCQDLEYMDFSANERQKFRLQYGDLLVCEGGEVGRTAIWKDEIEECYFQKALHRLRPKDDRIIPEYMLVYMQQAAQTGRFLHLTVQTSIAHLPQEKMALLKVVLPPRDEQERMVEIWSSLDDEIERCCRVSAKFRKLKEGLSADLLTGRVRIPPNLELP